MIKYNKQSRENLIQSVLKGIQEVKGKEIVTLDLQNLPNAVGDFFIICHGTSDVHVNTIAQSVEKEVYKATNEDPNHKEGLQNSNWILLDYFDVVVHIFKEETRKFYNLEKLWADAEQQEIEYQV